ncbi:hypothetical protein SynBIOSU31_02035 [Synechococcus sp. BIOS-U3-1]|nr:hypothetical protein SynBIOSU31_02035 [Synechococcus sp. BIOS-U3-1]
MAFVQACGGVLIDAISSRFWRGFSSSLIVSSLQAFCYMGSATGDT